MIATVQSRANVFAVPIAPPAGHKLQIFAAFAVMIGIPALSIAGGQAGRFQDCLSFAQCGGWEAFCFGVRSRLMWNSSAGFGFSRLFWVAWQIFKEDGLRANAVELAPYITAGISALPLLASLGSLGSRRTLPYVCAMVAILYGLILGLVSLPLFNVLRALLNWLVPVVFGLFIYQNRDLYPEFRAAIERSFLFGTLITGAYGIYQFFALPDWDRLWMLNVQLNSFGAVEAMKVRVFSTMNAPAIFAAVTACGLLLLFNLKGKLRLLSAACGFLALMLTVSRASWLSLLAVGSFYLLMRAGAAATHASSCLRPLPAGSSCWALHRFRPFTICSCRGSKPFQTPARM